MDGCSTLSMPSSVWLFGGTALNIFLICSLLSIFSEYHNVRPFVIETSSRGVWFLYRLDLGVSNTNLALVQVTWEFMECILKMPVSMTLKFWIWFVLAFHSDVRLLELCSSVWWGFLSLSWPGVGKLSAFQLTIFYDNLSLINMYQWLCLIYHSIIFWPHV